MTDTLANEVTETSPNNAQETEKKYSQKEVDDQMAKLKSSVAHKYEKKLEQLGDIDELLRIKSEYEQKVQEDQLKRGEFDKILQEKLSKKDSEIQKRDAIIQEYKINTPILEAASKYRAINAEQVKSLLKNSVKLNENGEVEVTDGNGTIKYKDDGQQYSVDDLVSEFLRTNTHFVSPTPATTHSKSNISQSGSGKLDITKLDMSNPKDREIYKQYRKDNVLN